MPMLETDYFSVPGSLNKISVGYGILQYFVYLRGKARNLLIWSLDICNFVFCFGKSIHNITAKPGKPT